MQENREGLRRPSKLNFNNLHYLLRSWYYNFVKYTLHWEKILASRWWWGVFMIFGIVATRFTLDTPTKTPRVWKKPCQDFTCINWRRRLDTWHLQRLMRGPFTTSPITGAVSRSCSCRICGLKSFPCTQFAWQHNDEKWE